MARVREVVARTRALLEEFQREGIPSKEIGAGILIALQAEPIQKLLEEHAEAKRVLERVAGLVREGMGLVAELRK